MAVNNVVLPFLMSMLLGRTIDLTTYNVGSNIYDDADYDETAVPQLVAKYNVIQDDKLPYAYFGIPPDIALRIKSGFLSSSSGIMGLDGILKDTSWKYNSAIVAAAFMYKTVERKLKEDAELLDDWKYKISETQTHYANMLVYGGWAVVLFRFKCDISSDVVAVRKSLTKVLGVSGGINDGTKALWDQAVAAIHSNADIRGDVQVSTHVYSTAPIEQITSIETLLVVIKNFSDTVGSVGRPMFMSLKPLNDLDKRYPVVTENIDLVKDLEKLDEMFDDVKVTEASILRWVSETLTIFNDYNDDRLSDLVENVKGCIRAFYKVSAEVSLFKTMDRKLLDSAFQKYRSGLTRGISTYNLAYRRLKEVLDAECEDTFLHRIRGLLKVFDDEFVKVGTVEGGLNECKQRCLQDEKCRSIGYAENLDELDLATGLYFKKEKQCWIYYRSSNTAIVTTPNGLSGDMFLYDRQCYSIHL